MSSGLEKPVFFLSNFIKYTPAIYGVMGAWRDCVMKVSVSKSKNQTIKDIMLKYSSSTLIKKEACRSVNVGYLFLKDIRKTSERSQAFYASESLYFYGEIADKLHDTFGFRTDYEIVSQREIKKILTATRK